MTVKEFRRSVRIWRSYGKKSSGTFFSDTVYNDERLEPEIVRRKHRRRRRTRTLRPGSRAVDKTEPGTVGASRPFTGSCELRC